MKFVVAIFALLASKPVAHSIDKALFEQELLGLEFDAWAEEHGKEYEHTKEKARRFEIWRDNHGEDVII